MTDPNKPLAWLPFSIAEAALSGTPGDADPLAAWSHLLSQLRDADIPTVATQLTQAQLDEQAALSAEANISQARNLFSYLG